MENTTLIDYLKVVDSYLDAETLRTERVLSWDIGTELLKKFRQEMLIKPQDKLMMKGDGIKEFMNQ